jgi:RimJ/RimL family protein N-acetyltransferase
MVDPPLAAANFRIEPATNELFRERGRWRYPPPYDFYDDDGRPPLNPEWFFSVHTEDGAIAGFYFFAERGDAIFYGLGLRPDLTGRGLGLAFVTAGLDFAREHFGATRFVLDVAEFNERSTSTSAPAFGVPARRRGTSKAGATCRSSIWSSPSRAAGRGSSRR